MNRESSLKLPRKTAVDLPVSFPILKPRSCIVKATSV
jgi:hypothetical protein